MIESGFLVLSLPLNQFVLIEPYCCLPTEAWTAVLPCVCWCLARLDLLAHVICFLADTNIIDLPSFMIPEGVNEVDVAVLSFVENACDLHVEPLTVDDWVLLEANAAWLEQGGLLQQVSLAYSGQVLTLCAGGRDVVRVKVNSTNFDSSPVVWPGDDNEASLLPRQSLRLVADTQVIVAPKIKTNVEDKDKVTLRAVPAALDYSASMLELADHIGVSLTDVAPFSAVVHPATLAVVFPDNSHSGFGIVHILSSDAQETPPSDETKSAVVHLSTCLDVPEDSIGKFNCALVER